MSGKGAKGLSGKGAKGTMGDKKGDKKKPVSRSARAGLQFPVGRIHRLLKVSGWRRRSRKFSLKTQDVTLTSGSYWPARWVHIFWCSGLIQPPADRFSCAVRGALAL